VDSLNQIGYSGSRLTATMTLGQSLIDQWQTSLLIIKMARDIKHQWSATSRIQEAEAVQSWIKNHVQYVSDPHKAEMLSDPIWMIKNGGDCDDMATLAGALLGALGHQCYFAVVQWKGRQTPTHAVCYTSTARCIVDAVSSDPQSWPPEGYEVERITYRKNGTEQSLDGMFGKVFKKATKIINKVIKPKTVLGKIADPLGLTSRNIKWGQKLADAAGYTFLAMGAGYGIGAAARGGYFGAAAANTAAGSSGFFNTAMTGAKVLSTAITGGYAGGAAAAVPAAATSGGFWATSGKLLGPMLLQGIMSGGASSAQQQGTGQSAPGGYYDPASGTYYPGESQDESGSQGGSGGSGGSGGYDPEGGAEGPTDAPGGVNPWVLAGLGAVVIYAMTPRGKK